MSRFEDMASDVEMAEREASIERARNKASQQSNGISAKVCECGCKIPKARRDALPGVRTCIDCARDNELLKRRYRN